MCDVRICNSAASFKPALWGLSRFHFAMVSLDRSRTLAKSFSVAPGKLTLNAKLTNDSLQRDLKRHLRQHDDGYAGGNLRPERRSSLLAAAQCEDERAPTDRRQFPEQPASSCGPQRGDYPKHGGRNRRRIP